MSGSRTALALEVDGTPVRVTSPDRVLWPSTGTTKLEVIDYYQQVAPALLPHLANRPVAFHRFPEGVAGDHFYEIRCPPHPPWVRTVVQRPPTGKVFEMAVLERRADLAWAAQLSAIELHPYLHDIHTPDRPHALVFDLDPGAPAGPVDAVRVALVLHEVLDAAGLDGYPKTSGHGGLHVYVPLGGTATYDETKHVARAIAGLLVQAHPRLVTAERGASARIGKVFIDWGQNDQWKSMAAPYSLRGTPTPTVSAPVTWDEVSDAQAAADPEALVFPPAEVVCRLDRLGDLFAPVLTEVQHVPDAWRRPG